MHAIIDLCTWLQTLKAQTSDTSPKVLLLVRHGDYKEYEMLGMHKTLTPCGIEQGRASRAVMNIPELPAMNKIFCSTITRARDTCTCSVQELSGQPS